MGTMDTVLMLGLVGVAGYVLYQNWGTISQGFGGGLQPAYAAPPTYTTPTPSQPTSQAGGNCTASATGVCCTDNAGNTCYKGQTSQGIKYECSDSGDADCDELRDNFVDRWAEGGEEDKRTLTPSEAISRMKGTCQSQGYLWRASKNCCACETCSSTTKCGGGDVARVGRSTGGGGGGTKGGGGRTPTGAGGRLRVPVKLAKPTPATRCPNGKSYAACPSCKGLCNSPGTFDACCRSKAGFYGYGGGYADFEDTLAGAPGRCQHLVHSPAAYHACVTNQVGAYSYGPRDGTYQSYEDLDEYGSYSTYWNRNKDLAGRAPMRITFG